VLEQKGEVRGHRRSEREDQSRYHKKPVVWTPCLFTVRPARFPEPRRFSASSSGCGQSEVPRFRFA
jgi:hypothetical protein